MSNFVIMDPTKPLANVAATAAQCLIQSKADVDRLWLAITQVTGGSAGASGALLNVPAFGLTSGDTASAANLYQAVYTLQYLLDGNFSAGGGMNAAACLDNGFVNSGLLL